MTKLKTPSSRWSINGEADPHKGKYDCERHELSKGDLTDDELANEVFMWGDHKPSMDDMLAGRMPIVYLTAGKERIRWLSRQNNKLSDDIKELVNILDEQDRYETADTPFKARVQAILVKHGVKLSCTHS